MLPGHPFYERPDPQGIANGSESMAEIADRLKPEFYRDLQDISSVS
jgi:hypothetical protein